MLISIQLNRKTNINGIFFIHERRRKRKKASHRSAKVKAKEQWIFLRDFFFSFLNINGVLPSKKNAPGGEGRERRGEIKGREVILRETGVF